ncbi:malectin domain-containing carbohydrate-binding protein [Sphingobacterium sp. LRF_L2]|uniref:malectin domain-containing carbohydrate-binding protein n=1 Tax=Sphingobacterium sp. LRF_L2 TaxID=3369421 RepID=UPI003F6192E4
MQKLIFLFIFFFYGILFAQSQEPRQMVKLDEGWRTTMNGIDSLHYAGFEKQDFQEDGTWKSVNVPHNWDSYDGYRRLIHGNLHGYAWYRKTFTIIKKNKQQQFYLFFEGVSSYATVWLNGKQVGYHAGGRTTFTIDVTNFIYTDGRLNLLAVRADHPAEIRDLPWVDGGCSTERGFSEGSQPMGIFRPVSLLVKNEVNIAPFGVHYWNDETATEKSATIHQTVELRNSSGKMRKLTVETHVLEASGKRIGSSFDKLEISALSTKVFALSALYLKNLHLWQPKEGYLYTLETVIRDGSRILDVERTPYGVRSIRWPKGLKPMGTNQLLVNGKPVFIHGIAEYEHKLGNSHAFAEEEISARVREMKAMGFNSFRDAHQPHNLRYQQFWDANGILLWTQMAAHIWFDREDFRNNFKQLLREWVKERRNSPSVFLWGLENESTLPADFAQECTDIIRSMDPTASVQRLVTTCNGGSGTDWDVPQNWTGTYGGDHHTYGEDLKKQLLVGEYGAWRTLELHSEAPYLPNHVVYSEDRFTSILETKLRLADSVKNEAIGHYLWLWNSHDNPGRVQGGEALRDLDKVGPVNYKGLLTPWGEPTDAYFMYRAHYGESDPMLYIASHTWPNRWEGPGIKNDIRIYSNCEEVELFNDVQQHSLGIQKSPGFGRPFVFDGADVRYNVLYAEGRINGKTVVRDTIVLFNLPPSPNFDRMVDHSSTLLKGDQHLTYLFRVNCGGERYVDHFGQEWASDQPYQETSDWGSASWTDAYEGGIQPFFASQRRVFDPIKGVADWPLLQSFRYGQNQLSYRFDVPDGNYRVELYFAEPWIGTGGGENAAGRRLFDIAINEDIVERKLDIWKEVGHDTALKRVYNVQVKGGKLLIHFPNVAAGQALIQAIAVASTSANGQIKVVDRHYNLRLLKDSIPAIRSWMDIGQQYDAENKYTFQHLPGMLYGADFFPGMVRDAVVSFRYPTNLYILGTAKSDFAGFETTGDSVRNNEGKVYQVYRKVMAKEEEFVLPKLPKDDFFAFQIQSGLQPAYDLKKTDTYKANMVTTYTGMHKVDFLKQERLQFQEKDGRLVFEVKVGVADVYSLTLKYHNPFSESRSLRVEVQMPDGKVLKPAEELQLDPTREGKWNYVNTNTGTMINAGTYYVILHAVDAEGVYIDGLDVQ